MSSPSPITILFTIFSCVFLCYTARKGHGTMACVFVLIPQVPTGTHRYPPVPTPLCRYIFTAPRTRPKGVELQRAFRIAQGEAAADPKWCSFQW